MGCWRMRVSPVRRFGTAKGCVLGFGIAGVVRGIAAAVLVFELCERKCVSTCWAALVWHPARGLRVEGGSFSH